VRTDLLQRLAVRTSERAQADLLRRARTIDHAEGPWLEAGDRRLLAFCSNDYLGLAQHPQLIAAFKRVADDEGVGSTAAHLVCGHRREHALLEEALAEWTGRERALLFSTGYMANLGVMQALLGRGDLCVQDKLNHACLLDGARLAGAELKRYPHADAGAAARQLRTRPGAAALLATDGVFSMDGDVAPLRDLAALCRDEGALLHVDDAHGLGVCGVEGAGSVAAAGLAQDQAPVLMATLGKALGVGGAFVAGAAGLIEGMVQFARSHVFTTAMPPAMAAATRAAVRIARHEAWRRDRLARLVTHFRRGAAERGIRLLDSASPIQPVRVGDSARASAWSHALETRGFYVPAIRPPTVPAGSARLRVTLSALHAESDVEALLDALHAARAEESSA
jgi:8-amino-7-oxononanoate synthase